MKEYKTILMKDGTVYLQRLQPTSPTERMLSTSEVLILELAEKVEELQDFAIWLTGCGYDFTQHAYYLKKKR